jgi:protein-tyrosine phosphatase
MNTNEYIRRLQEASAILILCACAYLLLNHGIPLQMEVNDVRNQVRWEAQR